MIRQSEAITLTTLFKREGNEKMDATSYFKKYGCVYGVIEIFEFGEWRGCAKKFTDLDEAKKWVQKEENDFGIKMLCSESYANKYMK